MKKQISGGVVLSFASQVISIVVGLVYTPILIRMLGQSEYGLYQLVQSVVNYLNLMNFGLSGAYIRYFSLARKKDDPQEIANINGLFLKIFFFIAALCLIAGGILLANIRLLGNQLTEADYGIARQLLVIMVINMAASFPGSIYMIYMSANEKFVFQKALGIFTNILVPLLNIPLLSRGYGSVGVVSVTLFLTVFRLIVNMWYCGRKMRMKINLRYHDKAILRSLLGFTFFIFLSDLVDQLNTNVDKLLLGRILGTVSVAIYSVGFNLKNYYTIISWIIPEMFIPAATRIAIEEKDDDKLTKLFTRIGRYNNFILLLVATGFFIFGRAFIHLWVGDGYENAYYVGLILIIAGYIPSIQSLGVNIQNAKNKHRTRSVVYFGIACVNVISSIFLIRLWGEVGTALGTLFAVLLGNGIFMNIYYKKKLGLDVLYFWKETLKWTVPAVLLGAGAYFALRGVMMDSWLKLGAWALAYSAVYVLLLWFVGFGSGEREKAKSFIGNRLKGLKKRS